VEQKWGAERIGAKKQKSLNEKKSKEKMANKKALW